jgi:hypothetical protein
MIQFGWGACGVTGTAFVLGTWLGYSVLESRTETQDIYLRSETIPGAKLIMVMSHHVIFYKEKNVYVVPTEDVRRIQSGPPG